MEFPSSQKDHDESNHPNLEEEIIQDFPNLNRQSSEMARRGRIDHDPSMKNIDLDLEIESLGADIRELFSKEIKIAKSNFEDRFKPQVSQSPFQNLEKIEIHDFDDFNNSLTQRAYYLNDQAIRDCKLGVNMFRMIYASETSQNPITDQNILNPNQSEISHRLQLPVFENEYRNCHFRLVNYILGLLKSNDFIIKVMDQIDLFHQIKEDFEGSINTIQKEKQKANQKLLKGDFEESNGENSPLDKENDQSNQDDKLLEDIFGTTTVKYRFGQSLKSIFQGYDFEYVIKVIFVLACFKRKLIKYSLDEGNQIFCFHIKLEEEKLLKTSDSILALISYIRTKFNISLRHLTTEYLLKHPLLSNLKTSQHMRKGVPILEFQIHKKDMITIAEKELAESLRLGYFEGPINVEFLEELLFFWFANNLVNQTYCPYVYCLKHFSESLMELNAALLNLKFKQILWSSEEKSYTMDNIFNKAIHPDIVIHKFQMITQKKQYFECKYDTVYLLIKYKFYKYDLRNVNDIFVKLNQLSPSDIDKDIIAEHEYESFKLKFSFMYNCFKKIIKGYLSQMLSIEQIKSLSAFLNNNRNVSILKSIDNSRLIRKVRKLNDKFLTYLDTQSRGDSLYNLYTKQLKNEMDLRLEINNYLGENMFPCEFYEVNKIEMLKDHILYSENVRQAYIKKTKEEMLILSNTVCFDNIENYWKNILNYVNDILKEHDQSGLNAAVPANLRFSIKDKRHLVLEKKLKDDAKGFRRVKPELIFEISEWNDIGHYISQMHWKVQNGLYSWYCLFVSNLPSEIKRTILKMLDWLGIQKIKSRVTSIKFFGIISKFFKFLDDAKELEGFKERFEKENYFNIPFEIMIDVDNTFGFSDTTKQENILWDKEFFDHLYEWMNRDTAEILYDIDITKDFELFMDHLFSDLNKTTSQRKTIAHNEKIIYIEPSYFSDKESILYGMFNRLSFVNNNNFKSYFYRNNEEEHKGSFNYKTFAEFSANFFNFSAEGSAQSFKVKLRESDELEEEKKKSLENYLTIKNKMNKTSTESDRENKAKGVSKTICFAITGESLPKIFYWVYGPSYKPALNLHIKKETKKLRHVINADLISFVKQTYIHDWLINSLNPVNKFKINSLLDNKERLIAFHKLKSTNNKEKWCVPIDLKDFHHHFGKTHYDTFCRVLQQKMRKSILCNYVKEDFEHILSTMAVDLSTGKLQFIFSSEEENLFKQYSNNKIGCKVNIDEKKPKREDDPKTYSYDLSFEVNNGLMSGWKMTSLFGSLFNLTMNHMSEFFNVPVTHDLVFDLNVLGDDTHFKRRFLTSSLNHISFVNMINKIAHPDKQIISTVSSEFLKKKINTISSQIHYSNVRTLTTLLFQKDNVKRLMNDKNFIKDNLDLWNLFLVRIENSEIVQNVTDKKYFHKFFENLMNFKRNDKIAEITKLINSPTYFVGFLPGPLRSLKIDFNSKQTNVCNLITNYELQKSLKVYELDIEPGHCKGVRSNVDKIIGGLKERIVNQTKLNELHRKLLFTEVDEMIQNTGEYYDCQTSDPNVSEVNNRKTHLDFKPIDEKEEETIVYGQQNQEFDIEDFISFSLSLIRQAIVNNVKFSGVIGELIYHNEKFSNVLCNAFRELNGCEFDINYIINTLKKLKKQTDLENPLTYKFIDKFDNNSFLKLATSNKHAISVSRNYKHDEIIGFLNFYFSKFIIFYIIEKSEIDHSQLEKYLTRINISLDYYLHQFSHKIITEIELIIKDKLKDFQNQ